MNSDLFELAAAISRAQFAVVRAQSHKPAPRSIYDNTACCQRCGREVRMSSYTPVPSAELLNFVCVTCCSGAAA